MHLRLRYLALLSAVILVGGCGTRRAAAPGSPGRPGPAAIPTAFTTADGWTIHGDYSPAPGARGAVVLLHQRGGSAADWQPLVARLSAAGLSALAVDQRGAGRSQGRQNGDDAPWDTAPDIAAAVQWLGTKGYAPAHVALAGASYGANNALIYAAAHPDVPAVVLLSPGTDYHGRRAEPAAAAYHGPILVVYATGDSITGGGPETIERAAAGPKEMKAYDGSAHGTRIFDQHPDALDAATSFLRAHLK